MEFKRNSDAKTIIMAFANEPDPGQAFVSAIPKNIENFLTSESSDGINPVNIVEGAQRQDRFYYRNGRTTEWFVTSDTATRVVGLQFADLTVDNVPNNSSIAFGSKYYSNDEQKAFALKYDCNISKSPSKTSYYFLNEEEHEAITAIQSKQRISMTNSSMRNLYFAPSLIDNAVSAHFDNHNFRSLITQSLIQNRIWAKLMPDGDRTFDHANKPMVTSLSAIDAIIYAYKFAYLGRLAYKGTNIATKQSSGWGSYEYPDLRYFTFNPTSYDRTNTIYNGKTYVRPLVYNYKLTAEQASDFNDGKDITLSIPMDISGRYRLSFERPGTNYYNNNTNIDLFALAGNTGPIHVTVNNKTPGIASIIRDDLYEKIHTSTSFSGSIETLDRLTGFLSENPNIKLVTHKIFESQLRNESPKINMSTYDSLFGMIASEDEMTRKTAIKMLQGFDIPENTDALTSYINDLAVDLAVNSSVTGASIDKWLIKFTGENLRRQPAYVLRNSRGRYHSSGLYNLSVATSNHSPFMFGQHLHPAMTYDERAVINEKYYELGQKIPQQFASEYKDCKKFYNHKSMICPYISPVMAYVTNKRATLDINNDADKAMIAYCDLYTRHYINYFMNRVFLGQINQISYDVQFKSPQDLIDFNATSSYIEKVFGSYKRMLAQAKAAALKNPFEFVNLIQSTYNNYQTKYSLSPNTWDRDREFDYIVQTLALKEAQEPFNKAKNKSTSTFENALASLSIIAQLGAEKTTEVPVGI